MSWLQTWLWRPTGRRARRWTAAHAWAVAMNDAMNKLPQEQQDRLDARLRSRLGLPPDPFASPPDAATWHADSLA